MYLVKYETVYGWGQAIYNCENEMYADLEVQGITEDNPSVLSLIFFEVTVIDGLSYVVNSWM